MNADATFAEVRALLARKPEEHDWIELIELYDWLDKEPAAQRDDFDARFGGYIDHALERWPDELRVIDWDTTSPRAIAMARTMRIVLPGSREHSERVIEDAVERLGSPGFGRIDGLDVRGLSLDDDFGPLNQARRGLRRFDLGLDPQPGTNPSARVLSLDDVSGLFTRLATLHGGTLEHLGVRYTRDIQPESERALDVMWESFEEALGAFTSLRSLSLGQTSVNTPGARRWAPRLFEAPGLERVEDLCLRCVDRDVLPEDLIDRAPWPSLRRVKILGMNDEDALRLVSAPALDQVDTWSLYERAPEWRPRGWNCKRTRKWTGAARRQRRRRDGAQGRQ